MSTYYLFRGDDDGTHVANVYDDAHDAAAAFVRCTGADVDPDGVCIDLRNGSLLERGDSDNNVYAVASADSVFAGQWLAEVRR